MRWKPSLGDCMSSPLGGGHLRETGLAELEE